ncbi:cobalt transporter CbiM [Neptunomonas marina]|uniref:Cobalt transporter CbiM n=1 Tax=Neptunomonas marina TaxID=1815562 RepID=A0A437Q473_9GAMM|nr:cobalt transporter CbiM [Neptunomonas marina]RVU29295.1 cobalt transporter CbiM [Neptunomonas marina]
MHIVDGALSNEILAIGAVVGALGVAKGLRDMDYEQMPVTALLASVFFVASYIHLPVGVSSIHLILNGLIGLALGWAAFPALLVALLLQAVFFGFGGFLVLGVNLINIAIPAVLVGLLLRHALAITTQKRQLAMLGALAGGGAVTLTAFMVAGTLALNGDAFLPAAKLAFLSSLPLVVIEAAVTAAAVALIGQVKPELFAVAARTSS